MPKTFHPRAHFLVVDQAPGRKLKIRNLANLGATDTGTRNWDWIGPLSARNL
jgi:hypothetical protein